MHKRHHDDHHCRHSGALLGGSPPCQPLDPGLRITLGLNTASDADIKPIATRPAPIVPIERPVAGLVCPGRSYRMGSAPRGRTLLRGY